MIPLIDEDNVTHNLLDIRRQSNAKSCKILILTQFLVKIFTTMELEHNIEPSSFFNPAPNTHALIFTSLRTHPQARRFVVMKMKHSPVHYHLHIVRYATMSPLTSSGFCAA